MTEYNVGDTFRETDRGQYWQVQEIIPEYRVIVRPEGDDADEDEVETMTVPGETLNRKREWGQLEPVSFEGDAEEDGESDEVDSSDEDERDEPDSDEDGSVHTCSECDRSFSSRQGMRSHKTQVHESDADE